MFKNVSGFTITGIETPSIMGFCAKLVWSNTECQ